MRLEQFFRGLGQAFGEAMAQNGNFDFDKEGDPGVSLTELDTSGPAPEALKISLAGSDTVRVMAGESLAIVIEGEEEGAQDAVRFKLGDGTLKIRRRRGASARSLTIKVTMPAPRRIAIAGSGTVEADQLIGEAKVSIGGSGTIRIADVQASSLTAKIGGSGKIEAAGAVDTLDLSIGGAGKFRAKALEVEVANIRIGGSGKAEFSSDGEVDARIGGVGDILIHGAPRCSLKAGGAGRIRCVPRDEASPPLPEAA